MTLGGAIHSTISAPGAGHLVCCSIYNRVSLVIDKGQESTSCRAGTCIARSIWIMLYYPSWFHPASIETHDILDVLKYEN